MSETTTTTPAPKTTKKAAKPSANGHAKKTGLRDPQIRILKALSKASGPLNRKALSKKAPVDLAFCTEYIGSVKDDIRKANDKKNFPSLITLGLVRPEVDEEDGIVYAITAKGKAALTKAE